MWCLHDYDLTTDDNSIKTFLKGIEDNSAAKSDRDDSIFVFSAKSAAETVW